MEGNDDDLDAYSVTPLSLNLTRAVKALFGNQEFSYQFLMRKEIDIPTFLIGLCYQGGFVLFYFLITAKNTKNKSL